MSAKKISSEKIVPAQIANYTLNALAHTIVVNHFRFDFNAVFVEFVVVQIHCEEKNVGMRLTRVTIVLWA